MKTGPHKEGDHYLSEINVTPLVDVFLVLLIISMITAPLLQQGLDVDLPTASAPALTRSETDVILTLKKNGRFYLQEEKTGYALEDLERKLGAVYKNREKKEIYLNADKNVLYGQVAQVISLFKKLGIGRVGMITREEET
ncbi:MAG: ExbD/TolR family protein [bacterium]|nr:ExbD/TolR family protein [bacterium]